MASLCGICLSIFCALLTVQFSNGQTAGASYRGKYIGPLTPQKHKVSGEVYAVDSRTLHIRGFTYDGTGPDAFFWTGFTENPSPQGLIIPNEKGTKDVLGAYNNQDITISLPDGLTLRDIKWIAVWCRAYEVNFGDLYIPANLDFPQPHVVGSLLGGHGVTSGPVVVVDAQTILVPDFTYDGKAPDLHFWVGQGVPGPNGIRVPDETGTDAPLVKADKKTMVLSLPGDLTVFDIDYFGVWCRLYSIDFGHVRISPGLNVPPSLRMLGIAPQLHPAPTLLPLHPHPQLVPVVSDAVQYLQPTATQHQLVQPLQTLVPHHVSVTPIPQQQYYMIVEDGSGATRTYHGNAGHAATPTTSLIQEEPQQALAYSPAPAQLVSGGGVVYSPPLQAAGTNTVAQSGHGISLGANGFSSFTIRTSKGSSTSDVLY